MERPSFATLATQEVLPPWVASECAEMFDYDEAVLPPMCLDARMRWKRKARLEESRRAKHTVTLGPVERPRHATNGVSESRAEEQQHPEPVLQTGRLARVAPMDAAPPSQLQQAQLGCVGQVPPVTGDIVAAAAAYSAQALEALPGGAAGVSHLMSRVTAITEALDRARSGGSRRADMPVERSRQRGRAASVESEFQGGYRM